MAAPFMPHSSRRMPVIRPWCAPLQVTPKRLKELITPMPPPRVTLPSKPSKYSSRMACSLDQVEMP